MILKVSFFQSVQVLILAPSRELCKQINEHIAQLTMWCKREVRYVDVAPSIPLEAQRPLLVGECSPFNVDYKIFQFQYTLSSDFVCVKQYVLYYRTIHKVKNKMKYRKLFTNLCM